MAGGGCAWSSSSSSLPGHSVWMHLLPPNTVRLQSGLMGGSVVGDTQPECIPTSVLQLPVGIIPDPKPQNRGKRVVCLEEQSQEAGNENCTHGRQKLRLTPKCPPRTPFNMGMGPGKELGAGEQEWTQQQGEVGTAGTSRIRPMDNLVMSLDATMVTPLSSSDTTWPDGGFSFPSNSNDQCTGLRRHSASHRSFHP